MKNLLTFIFFAMCTMALHAATLCTSIGSGTWSTSFSCSGTGSPVKYVIKAGHVISLNVNVTTAIDTLVVSGSLDLPSNKVIKMASTGVVIVPIGGTIYGGSNNSGFDFTTGIDVKGPFTGGAQIYGFSYAKNNTAGIFVSGIVLGLSLYDFDAKITDAQQLIVEWRTFDEKNIKHYEIEYASDLDNFKPYENVNPQGNTENQYKNYFSIADVTDEIKYIRIASINVNNEKEYSKIISVKNSSNDLTGLHVYPTVVSDNVSISANEVLDNTTFNIAIYSLDGKLMYGGDFASARNYNIDVNSLNLSSGYYSLTIRNNHSGELNRFKFFKL